MYRQSSSPATGAWMWLLKCLPEYLWNVGISMFWRHTLPGSLAFHMPDHGFGGAGSYLA